MTDTIVSSATREVAIGFERPFVLIGERINPTGRKLLAAEMAAGDYSRVKAGLAGTDDYLAEWRRESRPCGDELEAEVAAEVRLLESAYPAGRLKALTAAGGVAEDRS